MTASRVPFLGPQLIGTHLRQLVDDDASQDVFLVPGYLAIASEYADLGPLADYMGRCSRQVSVLPCWLSASGTMHRNSAQRLPVLRVHLC